MVFKGIEKQSIDNKTNRQMIVCGLFINNKALLSPCVTHGKA